MAGPTDEAADDVPYTDLLTDSRLLGVLAASAIGVSGINAVPPALAGISGAFGVSEARIGLVMSAFFLTTIVAIPVVGVLGDMYGRRRLLLAGLFVFGAAGVAIAFADSFLAVLAFRGIQGVGFAALTPFAVTVIGDLYTGPAGASAQGLRVSAHGVAQILLPAVAGVLADVAWNYPFFLYLLVVPVIGLVAVYLPETAETGATDAGVRAELGEYWTAVRAEAGDRVVLVFMLGGFAVFFLKNGVLTFLPVLAVVSLERSGSVAGLLVSLIGASRLLVSPATGSLTARLGRRSALVLSLLVAGAGAVVMPLAPTVVHLVPAVVVYGVGIGLAPPILNDGVSDRSSDEYRGGTVGALNVMKNVANASAPAVLGLVVAASGFGLAFVVVTTVAVAYAAAVYVLL